MHNLIIGLMVLIFASVSAFAEEGLEPSPAPNNLPPTVETAPPPAVHPAKKSHKAKRDIARRKKKRKKKKHPQ